MSNQATPKQEEALKAQVEFLNKVWTDEAFRARLESDPKAVLKEMGGQVPDDVQIKVVRDTDRVSNCTMRACSAGNSSSQSGSSRRSSAST